MKITWVKSHGPIRRESCYHAWAFLQALLLSHNIPIIPALQNMWKNTGHHWDKLAVMAHCGNIRHGVFNISDIAAHACKCFHYFKLSNILFCPQTECCIYIVFLNVHGLIIMFQLQAGLVCRAGICMGVFQQFEEILAQCCQNKFSTMYSNRQFWWRV